MKQRTSTQKKSLSSFIPKQMQDRYQAVTEITNLFCRQYLNDEYRELSEKLTAKLSQEKDMSLKRGDTIIWAASIIYAIGRVNFLGDKSEKPYLSLDKLCELMGVKQSTVSAKANKIMDMCDMCPLSTEWVLPSRRDSDMFQMIEKTGVLLTELGEFDEDTRVSVGAGDDGKRLRHYVVLTKTDSKQFIAFEKSHLEEVALQICKLAQSKMESVKFKKQVAIVSILLSPYHALDTVVTRIMEECNDFLRYHYLANNTGEIVQKDIDEYLEFLEKELQE